MIISFRLYPSQIFYQDFTLLFFVLLPVLWSCLAKEFDKCPQRIRNSNRSNIYADQSLTNWTYELNHRSYHLPLMPNDKNSLSDQTLGRFLNLLLVPSVYFLVRSSFSKNPSPSISDHPHIWSRSSSFTVP